MKIESSNYVNMIEKYRKQSNKTKAESKSQENDKVKVEISSDYSIYEKAMKELKKMDNCNNDEKLKAIASKIKDGSYDIDISKISRSIIERCEK